MAQSTLHSRPQLCYSRFGTLIHQSSVELQTQDKMRLDVDPIGEQTPSHTAFSRFSHTARKFIDRCERSLHHTNRSQYLRDEQHHKKWFVTQSAHVRECLAELLGTFVMICFGMGVNNQVSLSDETNGTWLSINMAWGIGILMAVYCSEGVSGAHLNPSVTLAHCVYGRLPWWKMPGYVVSQVVGAFVGAAAIYLLDYQKIQKIDPDLDTTQSNFATYPSADISNYTAFYTEALATGMLLLCIYAITDQNNRSPGTVGTPFAFALMIMALGMSFGMNTGYAMNPARDFGPRLLTYCVGYGSKVWTTAHHYFWIPIVAPLLGGVIGAGLYTLLVQLQHPHEHES